MKKRRERKVEREEGDRRINQSRGEREGERERNKPILCLKVRECVDVTYEKVG